MLFTKKKIFLLFSFALTILLIIYFLLKSFLSIENKLKIKKYLLSPFYFESMEKEISKQQSINRLLKKKLFISNSYIKEFMPNLSYFELEFKNTNKNINLDFESDTKISNNKILKKYRLLNGFYHGINNEFPGSGYLDFHKDNLIILSSRGILSYTENITKKKYLKQIKNNLNEFISIKQFLKSNRFSIKDIAIIKDTIFVSFTEEIKEDCWNTTVVSGNFNYKNIIFKKIFSAKECVSTINNQDGLINPHFSGGRIVNYDDSHILLSVGEYGESHLSQNKNSINGKIISININNGNYEIIAMGFRNPQGLFFDRENNFILETEHGPQGGDEINLIEIEKINKNKIPNYGWAISSYGEHYGGKSEPNKRLYKKYPLYKSHKKYGFIEPLKYFVPAIGISEIVKIGKNKYTVSSLIDQSIYFFELNNKKIINMKKVKLYERVRDLKFRDNKLYLFLEDTATIGIIELK